MFRSRKYMSSQVTEHIQELQRYASRGCMKKEVFVEHSHSAGGVLLIPPAVCSASASVVRLGRYRKVIFMPMKTLFKPLYGKLPKNLDSPSDVHTVLGYLSEVSDRARRR